MFNVQEKFVFIYREKLKKKFANIYNPKTKLSYTQWNDSIKLFELIAKINSTIYLRFCSTKKKALSL